MSLTMADCNNERNAFESIMSIEIDCLKSEITNISALYINVYYDDNIIQT